MTSTAPQTSPVEVAEVTDPGRDPKKQVNEDSCGHRPTRFGYLAVVCDGMGGHAGGREASQLAIATIFKHFDEAPADTRPAEVLEKALEAANSAVFTMEVPESERLGPRPGSTVVAVLVTPDGSEVAHVGDSRVYLVHEGQIFQVTRDHSVVQLMVDAQVLTPHQAANHPDANKIIRALGLTDDVEVELRPQPLHHVAGDIFVLCSDGLSDLVEPQELLEHVTAQPGPQAAGKLVALANARGGHDNITVQLVRILASAKGSPTALPPTIIGSMPAPAGQTLPPPPGGTIPPGAVSERPKTGASLPPPSARSASSATEPGTPVGANPSVAPPSERAAPKASSAPPPSKPSASPSARPSASPEPSKSVVVGLGLAFVGLLIALAILVIVQKERSGHTNPGAPLNAAASAPPEIVPALRTPEPTPIQPAPLPPPTPEHDNETNHAAPLPSLVPPTSATPTQRPRAPMPRKP